MIHAALAASPPFSLARFEHFALLFVNRPPLGLVNYLATSICGDRAWAWHLASACWMLVSALAIRSLLRGMLAFSGEQRLAAADLGAICWLVFPWNLGAFAWPIMGSALLAPTAFALSGAWLLRGWQDGHGRWLAPAAAYLVSCLTYEAFYGAFALLLILWLLRPPERGPLERRIWLRSAGGLAGAQVVAVLWNRLVLLADSGAPSKALYPDWLGLGWTNVRTVVSCLNEGVGGLRGPIQASLAALVAAFLVAEYVAWRRHSSRRELLRRSAPLLVAAAGVVLALFVIALASYGVAARGLGSRTMIGASFWMAIAIAWLAAAPSNGGARPWRDLVWLPAAALVGLLAVVNLRLLGDWAEVWSFERKILAGAPIEDLRRVGRDGLVLFVGPSEIGGVYGFAAPWDLNAAMHYRHRELRDVRFTVARADWRTTWDGAQVKHWNWVNQEIFSFRASEVWIWRYGHAKAKRALQPLTIGPEPEERRRAGKSLVVRTGARAASARP